MLHAHAADDKKKKSEEGALLLLFAGDNENKSSGDRLHRQQLKEGIPPSGLC